MFYATTDLEILKSDFAFELLQQDDNYYRPIYYINTNKMEYFYSYFNLFHGSIKNIWHRKIKADSVKKYIASP